MGKGEALVETARDSTRRRRDRLRRPHARHRVRPRRRSNASRCPTSVSLHGDALEFLERIPPDSLAGVRIFFPDPWPKQRQQHRRLVQPAVVDRLVARLRIGGSLHLATDIDDYATHMQRVCRAEDAPVRRRRSIGRRGARSPATSSAGSTPDTPWSNCGTPGRDESSRRHRRPRGRCATRRGMGRIHPLHRAGGVVLAGVAGTRGHHRPASRWTVAHRVGAGRHGRGRRVFRDRPAEPPRVDVGMGRGSDSGECRCDHARARDRRRHGHPIEHTGSPTSRLAGNMPRDGATASIGSRRTSSTTERSLTESAVRPASGR